MPTTDPQSLIRTRALLRELPEFDPDPLLWSRIAAVHAQRSGRGGRGRGRGSWIAAGIAATLAAVVLLPRLGGDASPLDQVELWQQRSQSLEQQWQSSARVLADPRRRADLHLIDGELQSAYDRGAAASELLPLWKQRNEALNSLINNDPYRAQAVTRI